jgi:hypothetical protein
MTHVASELNLGKPANLQKLSIIETYLIIEARRWFIKELSTIHELTVKIKVINKKETSH